MSGLLLIQGAMDVETDWLISRLEEAERLGADGVVAIRCAPLSLGAGTVGVAVYGTAVKFQ